MFICVLMMQTFSGKFLKGMIVLGCKKILVESGSGLDRMLTFHQKICSYMRIGRTNVGKRICKMEEEMKEIKSEKDI